VDDFDPEFAAWYRRQLIRDRELALGLAGIVTGVGLMAATLTTSAAGSVTGAAVMVAGVVTASGRMVTAGRWFAGFMRWWLDPTDSERRAA
jgi:uncharacterized membrane protein YkgB